MSSAVKQYEQVIANFMNEVSIYNKIQKAERNSNARIANFQKFINQNKTLLSNFTGVEKHICYFADTYKYEQIFDYSIIENSIPIFAIGVKDANMDILKQISSDKMQPTMLSGLKFSAFFKWLSQSMGTVTSSTDGQKIDIPDATSWMDEGFTID